MNGRVIKFEGSVHAQADRLLPWWINGTLNDDERAQVEQHLSECAQCRHEAQWLRRLQDAYASDDVPIEDPALAARRLRRRLAAQTARSNAPERQPWWRREWRFGWLAVAQAVLIVALGGALIHQRSVTYHTLGATLPTHPMLVVMFDPHTSEAQLRDVLHATGARIVGGPTETGAYLITVPQGQLASARTQLQGSGHVTLVESLDAGANP